METTKRKSNDEATAPSEIKKQRTEGNGACSPLCGQKVIALEKQVDELRLEIQTISKLEDTIENLRKEFEKYKEESKSASSICLDLLNNKVDKMVRLFGQNLESTSKITNEIKALRSEIEFVPKQESGVKFSMAGALRLARKVEKRDSKENNLGKEDLNKTPIDRLADYRWGQNLLLLGDNLWKSFRIFEDIHNDIRLMEKEVNLKMSCRENEVIAKLYDSNRDKILFPVPPRIFRIALSVGAHDLMSDPDLITLKDASFDECKTKNLPILVQKAKILKALILRCHSAKVQVIIVIPASGTQRAEIFKMWEEILLEELESILSSNLKILNFQEIVRSSSLDFKTQDELLRAWFINTEIGTLSAYGAKRLFDALKILARLGNKHLGIPLEYCPRCTRSHPYGQKKCKSLDRACNQCGIIGHFKDAHMVTDPVKRREIIELLGCDIYDTRLPLVYGCAPNPDPHELDCATLQS